MEELENNLDASIYEEAINDYELEFKNLLTKIYQCYKFIIKDKTKIPSNDENKIRDILLNYLKDTKIRQKKCLIQGYRFDKEVDENKGRVDIKIIDYNDFESHNAYYIIECKRLDGKSVLNKAYAKDGIERFTSSYKSKVSKPYYSSYYGVNGMIGFVVANININSNMKKIGNFFSVIEENKLYESTHKSLKLYHLMMDFSDCLQ